jgi:NAD dependent epimerase/dehydratase family enzyme
MVPLDPVDPERATVGGVLAVGESGIRRLRYGPVRDTVLEVRFVNAAGKVVKAGGPVVKNVTGYDLCRLLVGSVGTLGFLAEVVHAWEAATEAASDAGSRVCLLRTTLAVHRSGGLLKPQLPAFKLGLGAKLGTGRQHMSLISRQDWVRAVCFLAEHDLSGPFNLSMPGDATNEEFSDAVAEALGRKRLLAAPKFAIQLGARPVAGDLLGSLRVKPQALLDAGFTFDHPDLASVVDAALHQ